MLVNNPAENYEYTHPHPAQHAHFFSLSSDRNRSLCSKMSYSYFGEHELLAVIGMRSISRVESRRQKSTLQDTFSNSICLSSVHLRQKALKNAYVK